MSLLHMKKRLASVWSNYSSPETPPSSECGFDQEDEQQQQQQSLDTATTTTSVVPQKQRHCMAQVKF